MRTHDTIKPTMNYQQFLAAKAQDSNRCGFAPIWMPDFLFDFQAHAVERNIVQGKSADFLDCGMGKTAIQLVWAENVVRHTNKAVLDLTPIAVGKQTIREAEKFGIAAYRCNDGNPRPAMINVTNYEKLHLFDPNDFAGVVCDESSAIKAFDGKRRAQVTEFLRTMKYRLLCTATAAPNDYVELGTSSEALGVMGQVDMLNRFFRNDQNTVDRNGKFRGFSAPREFTGPGWRFKGHAETAFWRWVCSWARAARRPSDLGPFSDDRFVLPPLVEREHIVETRTLAPGYLIPLAAANRQEELEERRRTIAERCELMAALSAGTGKPYIAWCQLNPEGELLERLMPDAVHISGADPDEEKEEKYEAFLTGQRRGMISKQRIGGWGLNCQHCPHVLEFADHSFEAHYQGVRRCWRFGQTQPVINDIISTEGQRGAKENMQRKARNCDRMFSSLVQHMNEAMHIDGGYKFVQKEAVPSWL